MQDKNDFEKLPVEVISHIFSFLQFEDRKNASTVCWPWYEASIHPMFLNNEVICLDDLNNGQIHDVLRVYTRSLRPFFSFKIRGLGVLFQDSDDDCTEKYLNESHWVKVVWPLLAKKVIFLEFFDSVEFIDGILPAILNETHQLKVLIIHNLQYSPKEELFKVNRLQSLRELTLNNFLTDNVDKNKLLRVIPKELCKICFKSMLYSRDIVKDLSRVFNHCSLSLETLELIDIDVTPELMESISSIINLKLKTFTLILADSIHYDHEPETIWPLFKTQWPLISLTLVADCLTYVHFEMIADTFKNLEILSVARGFLMCHIFPHEKEAFRPLKKLKTFNAYFL